MISLFRRLNKKFANNLNNNSDFVFFFFFLNNLKGLFKKLVRLKLKLKFVKLKIGLDIRKEMKKGCKACWEKRGEKEGRRNIRRSSIEAINYTSQYAARRVDQSPADCVMLHNRTSMLIALETIEL